MVRKIKNHELELLKRELYFLETNGTITSSKVNEIVSLYEAEERFSFTKTLLYVGSILVGAGILSFIASNWADIGKTVKVLLILLVYIGSIFAGFKLEQHYPKTSKSLYYLAVIVFGAGIFLVGQMFHFGGDFQNAFLWWSLGILPLAWVLKDKRILLAAALFALIYLFNSTYLSGAVIPYWILLWIAAIYVLNERIGYSRLTGFVSGMLMLTFIGTVMSYMIGDNAADGYVYGIVYLLIGVFLAIGNAKFRQATIFLGHLTHGGAALMLSFQDRWPFDWLYLPFSLLYLLFVLFLIKKGSLLNIVILCVLIFRFYLDISFAFLPKSFVFIFGGLLLLGFGFYFEKQRKKAGGGGNE
ncbi:DUF2157 domain-containing protein [Neobacillus sp. SM06]|uniref:DUF2157 domain-containing protein n=1 Tax=Neobacillus sp. SM06 TaxID=3422492 RepID=UPI003D2A35AA